MKSQSKVSIIIPSYNHKKYILETLRSIREQTYNNIETIVIDDGSTDGSVELLKTVQEEFKFQLFIKENEGICKTLNQGLALAKGEYIVIIASDDFMPSERISEQVDAFSNDNYDVVAGGVTLIDEMSKKLKYAGPPKIGAIEFSDMLDKNVIFAPAVMFKSSTFKKFGLYNPEFSIEDYPMWLKILSNGGKIINFDKNWAYYRVNQIATRQKIDWYYKSLVRVFSEYLNNPIALKAFTKIRLKYLIKVSVFDGLKGLKEVIKQEEDGLNRIQLSLLYIIAMLPVFIRNILKKRINKV